MKTVKDKQILMAADFAGYPLNEANALPEVLEVVRDVPEFWIVEEMKNLLVLVLGLLAAAGSAAEVDLSAARQFAHGWRGRVVTGGRTVRDVQGASRFHVVTFEGGGWAAVGADDGETPVIAFSDCGEDLVENDANPVWFLVKRDAERRAKMKDVVERGKRCLHHQCPRSACRYVGIFRCSCRLFQ